MPGLGILLRMPRHGSAMTQLERKEMGIGWEANQTCGEATNRSGRSLFR